MKINKNWIYFLVRNAVVYSLIVAFFSVGIYYFKLNSEVVKIRSFDEITLAIFLLSGVCILYGCLLFNIWLSKTIVKLSEILKISLYILAIYIAVQPQYKVEDKITLEIISLIIYLTLCSFSIKDLFWEKQFRFKENSSFVEDHPMFDMKQLTINQRKAFEQLNDLLESSSAHQSYVTALVGKWGTGKTGITNSLYSLHKDEYLFLFIDLLLIKKTNDLIEYINSYFKDYFYFYGIGFWGGNHDIKFFKTFIDYSSENIFQNIWKEWNDNNHFHDIHTQRVDFSNNVQRLLKKSGKKKIVFIIDDMDRVNYEEEVYPLLLEITDIPGIFSVLNLAKVKRYKKDEEKKNEKEKDEKTGIDKYIQVEIFLDGINYLTDDPLSREIEKQYLELNRTKEKLELSVFDKDEKASKSHFPVIHLKSFNDPHYKILVDDFYEEFKNSSADFGTVLQKKIVKYYKKILGENVGVEYFLGNDKLMDTLTSCFGRLNGYTELCLKLFQNPYQELNIDNKDDLIILFGDDIEWKEDEGKILNEGDDFTFKLKQVVNHIFYSGLLWKFFEYMSNSLDNYREFKHILKEAKLLKISYIENIVRRWKYTEEKEAKEKLYNSYFSIFDREYHIEQSNFSVEYLLISIFYNTSSKYMDK